MSDKSPPRAALTGLRGIRLLDGLDGESLDALAHECAWRRYRRGQRVISREARDRDVYLVVAGRLRVAAFAANGRQVTYREIAAGELFGELAAVDRRARSADVDAMEDTLVGAIRPEAFLALLRGNASVSEALIVRLAGAVRELTDRVFELSTLGVQNRVHAELLRLARESGATGNTARLEPAPRHADLASRVSTSREEVTRELSALRRRGLLARVGHALVVRDVALLERLVSEVRQAPRRPG